MARPKKSKDPVAEAREHYRAGRNSQAEFICRKVIAESPRNDAAWELLGVMALEVKREELAMRLFMRALDIAPEKSGYYVNLATGLHRFGKTREAVDALRLAISLKPNLAEAHFNLARCFMDLGDDEQAFIAVEKAANLKPNNFEIQLQFARMLRLRGQAARSIEPYRRAIGLEPKSLECLVELAMVLRGLQRAADTLDVAKRAVELAPDSAAANNELGLALILSDLPDEAIRILTRATELDPTSAEARCSLGYALETVGRLDEAIESFRLTLSLDATLHNAHSNIIFLMPFVPGVNSLSVLEETRAWSRAFAEQQQAKISPHGNDRSPDRRLRIGYVSAHFYNHCQAFFTTPLFENHDHDQFEIYGYSSVDNPDEATLRLKKC